MEKIKCSTPDFAVENAKKLLALFPECATERKEEKGEQIYSGVDLERLKQLLSSTTIEGNVERYQFTWPGKHNAMVAANVATTKTLRPCLAESTGRDGTPGKFDSQNLYIEGDNLEVLKILQRDYADRVKMIYIDPPYNTGHDFVYRDRFSLTQREIDDEAGAFDEDGNRFEVNDSAEARYHSNWCSMMYPRLKLARNLLRDDGVIFISIDDNEVSNLRKLCDDIFGEHNIIAAFVVIRSEGGGLAKQAVIGHDYLLAYARDLAVFKPLGKPKDIRGRIVSRMGEEYWIETDWLRKEFGKYGTCLYEDIVEYLGPKKKEEIDDGLERGAYLLIDKGSKHVVGRYRKVSEDSTKFYTILKHLNKFGSADLEGLGLATAFSYAKPVSLVKELILGATIHSSSKDDLVLDFFSGSATTAHAVMQLNAEDGGTRKFIMVQLPEPCAEDSEAAKAGYKNICEIGKERIRRAGKKILDAIAAKNAEIAKENVQGRLALDNTINPVEKTPPDIGFRVLKLDSSSLNDTSATVGDTTQECENFDRIKSDRKPEDLLFQLLVETRIPLSDPIAKVKIGGNNVFFVGVDGGGAVAMQNAPLAACLDPKAKLTNEFFIELAKLTPGIAFFRDDAFVDDSARVNVEQIFAQFSPTTSIKVI